MVKITKLGDDKAKASSKWLYVVLCITLAITAWTAFHSDNASEVADNELGVKNTLVDNNKAVTHRIELHKANQTSASKTLDGSFSSDPIPWEKLKREHQDIKSYDVFKVHSWVIVPPVKKPPPPPPPPPPRAPPAPFTYVGKLDNSTNGTQIFLMENNKLFSVLVGDKINTQWRLDGEDLNSIRLTFLPLDLKQVLSKSAKQVVPTAIEVNQ